jgi:SAM-dependent methyltransferase
MRSIIHALSVGLFGKSLAIADFPAEPPQRGLGMSDWNVYAERLAEQLDYQNTFLHEEPVLDILQPDPSLFGTLDFLISTDVFEHVTPPVQPAFDNALRLLRPGGVFVFSVPYGLEGDTIEHFPALHDFRVEKEEGGGYILHNRTADGREERYQDLVFHGGPGQTLEMRVFSRDALLRHFEAAGFDAPYIHDEDVPEFGILPPEDWSLTWAVRRPLAGAAPTNEMANVVLFDQHSRYASVGEVLGLLAEPGASVLDVGSGEARLLDRYARELECSYLDPLLAKDEGTRVLAGGFSRLAEEERTWDWLVSVDTLEHIPEAERGAFLRTLVERARVGLVVSGPCIEDAAALEVDDRVNESYRRKTGEDYPWLVEHKEFGLPSRSWMIQELQAAGFETQVLGNGHAPWLGFLLPYFVCYLDDPQHLSLLRELSGLFNEKLYRFDHLPPHYRSIVVATKGTAQLSALQRDSGAEMRAHASQAWEEFQAELVARSARHSDELALRPAGHRRNPHARSPQLERARRQIVELQALLVAERDQVRQLHEKLEHLGSSRIVRLAVRLGLIDRP